MTLKMTSTHAIAHAAMLESNLGVTSEQARWLTAEYLAKLNRLGHRPTLFVMDEERAPF